MTQQKLVLPACETALCVPSKHMERWTVWRRVEKHTRLKFPHKSVLPQYQRELNTWSQKAAKGCSLVLD